jgi:hypothetical protein
VIALAINSEDLSADQMPLIFDAIRTRLGLPAWDVLGGGAERRVEILLPLLYLLFGRLLPQYVRPCDNRHFAAYLCKNLNWNR